MYSGALKAGQLIFFQFKNLMTFLVFRPNKILGPKWKGSSSLNQGLVHTVFGTSL